MSYNKPDCTGCPYAGNILMMRPPECPDAYAKVAPMCGIYPHKEDLASEEVHRRRQDRK